MMWCDGVDGWVDSSSVVTDKFDLAKWEKRERAREKGRVCWWERKECININQLSIDSTFQFAWIKELRETSFFFFSSFSTAPRQIRVFLFIFTSHSIPSSRSSLRARCLKGDIGPRETPALDLTARSEIEFMHTAFSESDLARERRPAPPGINRFSLGHEPWPRSARTSLKLQNLLRTRLHPAEEIWKKTAWML